MLILRAQLTCRLRLGLCDIKFLCQWVGTSWAQHDSQHSSHLRRLCFEGRLPWHVIADLQHSSVEEANSKRAFALAYEIAPCRFRGFWMSEEDNGNP